MDKIRQPIVAVLGHVDHGKTLLLDSIRGTTVQHGEAGGITQHVGASHIPIGTIKDICGPLMKRLKTDITIPGLLFIDTPGHEAFVTLRKRGGSVADIAVLVVNLNIGFQPQTEESLAFLREFKTPFIVAATQVDCVTGWKPNMKSSITESASKQIDSARAEMDRKLYDIIIRLSELGFNAERFDKIEDFTKQVAIVPCSGMTGEGVPELLMMITGLAQQFLKNKLALSDKGRGVVLEVKELKGLGTTIDVILYDGSIKRGDSIVIGGKDPIVTKVKALLRPKPLKELRVEKQFDSLEEVNAASGIKIAAPGLESAVAGSPMICVRDSRDIGKIKDEVQRDVEQVEFTRGLDGLIIKADTLGGLDAMIKIMGGENIPIRKAGVGKVNKQDVTEAQNVRDDTRKAILAFNVDILEDAEELSKNLGIKVFQSKVIYKIIEDYTEWVRDRKNRDMQAKLEAVPRPVKLKLIKGCVFHASNPCVIGVEILSGHLKKGARLRRDSKIIGKVKEIQKDNNHVDSADAGDKVAISMDDPVVGRHIFENDTLVSYLTPDDKNILLEVSEKLSASEKELLKEL